ncbi:MAG TPA: hypothetical protein VIY56_03015 [Vicinamibacterales bacterium]
MKLLFSVNNFGFLRNFEHALHELAARGHRLHLLADRKDSVGGVRTIETLQRQFPDRVTWSYAPSRKNEPWQALATQARLCLDAWRYLDPRWDDAVSLRARAARQAPALASWVAGNAVFGSRAGLALWRGLFRTIEQAMPPGRVVEDVLREHQPDLLLLTPLLYFGSQQVEYVRAARAMGIPTVLGVGSWDHLTTKGLIHERPTRVMVWNEMQRQEAEELHGVPRAEVTVTGAQAYDHWFTQQPATTRAEFSARVGVPADRRLLLYLCSSPFITPYEVGFVRRWIAAVRQSADPELRRAALLIRPHPQNADQWADFDPSFDEAVGIWPRAGANPVDSEARADYYDSMYHSAAVVGVNTSALIESGIVGRPVFTVLDDEFAGQQEGTLHFQHLKSVNGGLLQTASTLDEHCRQVAAALRSGIEAPGQAFIEAFVRPYGLATPAAALFADAVEAEAAKQRPRPAATPVSQSLLRVVLRPVAAVARRLKPRRKLATRDDKDDARPGGAARILFVLSSPEYLRYYDTTMRLLADRGHTVLVAVNALQERKHARLDLVDDARIEVLGNVAKRNDLWMPFARAVRGTIDFARYLHPRFADAPLLRARMYRKVLPPVFRPLNRIRALGPTSYRYLIASLQAAERAVPIGANISRFLEQHAPDAVVVSPLVDAASDQVDVVRAAQARGVPVAAAIASWDNLTNKGHLRVLPDMVTVWNEQQRAEAAEFHGVPAERVAVTGAQPFDRWFEREPSTGRAQFCAAVGLPDDRPFVLFTGSSVFIAKSDIEVPFVRRWIEALRASGDARLRDAAVLVRPHPFNTEAWTTADFSDLGPVAVFPRTKFTPADDTARTSFFDSLYFSAAVVGINTSAMIEAAILRKPVLSLLTPEFAGTQEGTLHFHYLLPENGGFLRVANALDAHVAQLTEVLQDPEASRVQTERFVERFLRPNGLTVPATPLLADAFVRLAHDGRAPLEETIGTKALRVFLWPVAFGVRWFRLDADWRVMAERGSYRAWGRLSKTWRIALKRLVVRPLRWLLWAAGRAYRLVRRLVTLTLRVVKRIARAVVMTPVRLVRRGRFYVGTLRGEILGGEGGDGRGPR